MRSRFLFYIVVSAVFLTLIANLPLASALSSDSSASELSSTETPPSETSSSGLSPAELSADLLSSPDQSQSNHSQNITPIYGYRVVRTYPHDKTAFTEGLVYDQDRLYESTGLYGRSELRLEDLETGEVLKRVSLPNGYFGEGIALWNDSIIQLTWHSNKGFIYNKESFNLTDNFTYPTEGWGMTSDGTYLIMSDGTDTLHYLDPNTMKEVKQLMVRDRGGSVLELNELEYIQGLIYANYWPTYRIAIISPKTGEVVAWADLEGIIKDTGSVDTLNGIAYVSEEDRLFVAGKFYPEIMEIKLIKRGKR